MFKSKSALITMVSVLILGMVFPLPPTLDNADAEIIKQEAAVPQSTFADILKGGKTGVEKIHSKEKYEKLLKQAKLFAGYRKENLSNEDKAELLGECLARPESNIFCKYLSPDWAEKAEQAKKARAKKEANMSRKEIRKLIKEGDIHLIKSRSRGRIAREFRRFEWDQLERAKKIAKSKCASTKSYLAFGLRAEEDFPDKKYRDIAAEMYSRSEECHGDEDEWDESLELSRFRLALIHIWNKDCKKANPLFEKLSVPNGNFVTRAYYWRAVCARESGDRIGFETLKNQLFKVNPMGYHGIALSGGRPFEIVNLMYREPQAIWMRSVYRPRVNEFVTLTELLQAIDEKRLASEFLDQAYDQIGETEPRFNLYLAVLAKRNNWVIPKFRILKKAFYENPQLISRDNLEMFFPLKNFSVINRHKRKIDPYFVAALIRQESAFVPHARSSAGALGLMQLMPATARRFKRVSRWQLLRPRINVSLGVRYLRTLLKKYDWDAELALAAYNAGPHRVDSWKRRYQTGDRMLFLDLIPFSETRNYVALIGRNFYWYLALYSPENIFTVGQPSRSLASKKDKQEKIIFSGFRTL